MDVTEIANKRNDDLASVFFVFKIFALWIKDDTIEWDLNSLLQLELRLEMCISTYRRNKSLVPPELSVVWSLDTSLCGAHCGSIRMEFLSS